MIDYKEEKLLVPREDSNLNRKFFGNHRLNAVGLFELPRKLPIPIARCDGTAWHPVGSPEHAPWKPAPKVTTLSAVMAALGRCRPQPELRGSPKADIQTKGSGHSPFRE